MEHSDQFSIWSSFDGLLQEAEKKFFEHDFASALKNWYEYAHITGASNWQKIYSDLDKLIAEFLEKELSDPQDYFERWIKLRRQINANQLSVYAFERMQKLYAKIFLASKQMVSFDLATGIFCYIDERFEKAQDNLTAVLNQQPENMLSRIFLSKTFFALNEDEKGLAYLTQAMFLAGNELLEDDIRSDQLRNLYGKLRAVHGKGEIGIWLVPFEAWFRNWLIWNEDTSFFQVMQIKERNERILQVKYYTSEKYRHFVRCLFIAEYVRLFLPKEKGIIWEQEAYMEKLDANLFQRYRKKRKPIA